MNDLYSGATYSPENTVIILLRVLKAQTAEIVWYWGSKSFPPSTILAIKRPTTCSEAASP